MKKIWLGIAIVLLIITGFSASPAKKVNDDLCADNEKVIFSFKTTSSKTISICAAKDESYLVYRFGTKNKVELEFPESKAGSWEKFTFYHQRGDGGTMEDYGVNWYGEYLFFINGASRYEIYNVQTYNRSGETEEKVGITVTHITSKKDTVIKGVPGSRKGDLSVLRDKVSS